MQRTFTSKEAPSNRMRKMISFLEKNQRMKIKGSLDDSRGQAFLRQERHKAVSIPGGNSLICPSQKLKTSQMPIRGECVNTL